MEERRLEGPVARLLVRSFVQRWTEPERSDVAARIGLVGLAVTVTVNLLLFGFKLGYGLHVGSLALIADALDTLGDVLLDAVGVVGFAVSLQAPDNEHPYGHQRAEEIASVTVSVLLVIVGITFGAAAAQRLLAGQYGDAFAWAAVAVALTSVLGKWAISRLTFHLARYTQSPLLSVSGWHYITDVFSGLLAAVALAARRVGVVWLDPVFAVLIALMIVGVAVRIFFQNANSLVGRGASPELLRQIHLVARSQPGVLGCSDVEVHWYGRKKRLSLRVEVADTLTLREGHEIAEQVQRALHETHADWEPIVHVDPVNVDERRAGHAPEDLTV